MTVPLPYDLAASPRLLAGVSGLSLVMAARWIWKGQALASLFRYGAVLLAFVGVLAFLDVFAFRPARAQELVRTVVRVATTGRLGAGAAAAGGVFASPRGSVRARAINALVRASAYVSRARERVRTFPSDTTAGVWAIFSAGVASTTHPVASVVLFAGGVSILALERTA
jgi:hypothetical protein